MFDSGKFLSMNKNFDQTSVVYHDHIISALNKLGSDNETLSEPHLLIASFTGDLVCLIDIKGHYLYASPSHESVLGIKPENMIGVSVLEYIHPDERQGVEGLLADVSRIRQLRQNFRFRTESDEYKYLRTTADVIFDKAGEPIRIVCVSKDITEQVLAQEEVRKYTEQLRGLTLHIEKVREEERLRLARDIHDILGSSLAALKMELGCLLEEVSPRYLKSHPEISERIDYLLRLTTDSVAEMRNITRQLRPELLDELGLPESIRWYAQECQKRSGIHITINIRKDIPALQKSRAVIAYRIFQEIMTNIINHSRATQVSIQLTKRKGHIYLTVKDNGTGITREQMDRMDSFGILGMKERTLLLRGCISISGKPDEGTTVILKVPGK